MSKSNCNYATLSGYTDRQVKGQSMTNLNNGMKFVIPSYGGVSYGTVQTGGVKQCGGYPTLSTAYGGSTGSCANYGV